MTSPAPERKRSIAGGARPVASVECWSPGIVGAANMEPRSARNRGVVQQPRSGAVGIAMTIREAADGSPNAMQPGKQNLLLQPP
jgi:hypothetical protein